MKIALYRDKQNFHIPMINGERIDGVLAVDLTFDADHNSVMITLDAADVDFSNTAEIVPIPVKTL